ARGRARPGSGRSALRTVPSAAPPCTSPALPPRCTWRSANRTTAPTWSTTSSTRSRSGEHLGNDLSGELSAQVLGRGDGKLAGEAFTHVRGGAPLHPGASFQQRDPTAVDTVPDRKSVVVGKEGRRDGGP